MAYSAPPPHYTVPPFPSLHIPSSLTADALNSPNASYIDDAALRGHVDPGGYFLYSVRDAWRFTVLWTLIVYALFHLGAWGVALVARGVGGRARRGVGRRMSGSEGGSGSGSEKGGGGGGGGSGDAERGRGRRSGNWRFLAAVGLGYLFVAGLEAVMAGSIVGVLLGAHYKTGNFRMSTWIPLIWSVINVLVLILSTFSMQGGL